ncbi:MAG: hypothetical protein MJA29_14370 [Candidatus Omnitrophica bacterium]|nr:hypothetical protein [Candidatus Omnitrophota bacterium]
MTELGFSEEVIDRISHSVRKSTLKVYEGKWSTFFAWCARKQLDPFGLEIASLCDFFNHLFVDKKLEVRTIEGYRSAISKVWSLAGIKDLSNDVYLRALFNNFALERPLSKGSNYPKWDLRLVLDSLGKALYEPLSKAPINLVTQKTVFLLLLASGARRSEVHAIDVNRIVFDNDGKSVLLRPRPGFLAKNHNVRTGFGEFFGFTIKSLKEFVGPDLREDALLCPLRALKYYLKASESRRGGIAELFITCKEPVRAAHKNTITAWVKTVLSRAYNDSQESADMSRPAHELRAVGPSLAVYNCVSVDDVMAQCRWRQHNTFTSFYLRDLALLESEGFGLPPVFAAGNALCPSSHSSAAGSLHRKKQRKS